MDYKDTLNLPATSFPMKANLLQKEPERIEKWQKQNLYKAILEKRDKLKKYILHDGPPYANGNIHMGHALNKILKDIIVKIKSFQGYYTPYIPGWDCHGLPIEHQVDKELGKQKYTLQKNDIRKKCREYARKYIEIQKNEFIRLGILGDWDKPYVTMDYEYEAVILSELYKFFNNGSIYKSSKPVYWCIDCVTALAEAEVEYNEHTSPSIYVKFKAESDVYRTLNVAENEDLYFIIWTTTPWTLPANLAVALHPNFDYALVKITTSNNKNLKEGSFIVIANELLNNIIKALKIPSCDVIKVFKGSLLDNTKATHPFYDRHSKIILAEHVTIDQGTGLVHTAPGHGLEDYIVGLKYNLEVYNPVDDNGNFVKNLKLFGGKNVFKANKEIVDYIDRNGSLLLVEEIKHQYPHCWRCKNPVIYRATPQWFISMESNNLRKNALKAIKEVKWIPSWGENRIYSMIENRPDWCISRQRTWGVPIAVVTCTKCGNYYINHELQNKIVNLFKSEGADAWFHHPVEFFIGSDITCNHCGSHDFKKEEDILDVWFDSGSSHAAVCERRDELTWPANMYLEGSDQHRGWFHSSLLESVGTREKAPYKEVLTHGFVVDGSGKKMSKSFGNVITPFDIVNKHGVEILRLWVSAEDYSEDIRLSNDIINRLVESYRKIRNTARYMLGNIYDFNPDTDAVPFNKMMELDKYILIKWQQTKSRIYKAFNDYQFHIFYHTLLNFCVNDLSAFYIDVLKDRLYCERKTTIKRRSAQTAIFTIIKELAITIAPILSFTADEIWEHLQDFTKKEASVFFEIFPKIENYKDNTLENKFAFIISLKNEVNKKLEAARANKALGHPLDAKVIIGIDEDEKQLLQIDETLEKIFIVSEVEFKRVADIDDKELVEKHKIIVETSKKPKCERCWNHSDSIGKNMKHPKICERCFKVLDEN